jgi:hypothetical protein
MYTRTIVNAYDSVHSQWVKAQSIQSARLSLQSSELTTPTPSPASECCPPTFGSGGRGAHSLAGEGAGGANSDEGIDTLVLYGSKEDSKWSGLRVFCSLDMCQKKFPSQEMTRILRNNIKFSEKPQNAHFHRCWRFIYMYKSTYGLQKIL